MAIITKAIKQSDESRNYADTGGVLVVDSELFVPVEAGKSYWMEFCAVSHAKNSYAERIVAGLYTSGGATLDDSYVSALRVASIYHGPQTSLSVGLYTNTAFNSGGILGGAAWVDNTWGDSSSSRGAYLMSGVLHVATSGQLEYRWAKAYNGFGPDRDVTVFAGSYMMLYELNPCA